MSDGKMKLKKKAKKKPAKPLRTRSPASVGYKKADETRQRILKAALRAFGEASFKAVTTRRICSAAEVSLPTLTYYFGDKEGLYRACAEAVVERYRGHTSGAAANAAQILSEPCSPEEARTHLKAVVGALAGLLVESSEAEDWVQFVGWELRDPGPAFEILYEHLWRPGSELTSRLVGRMRGRVEPNDDDRICALLLISSLLAFQSGRNISMRSLKWSNIGPAEVTLIRSSLDAQIDAIGPKQSGIGAKRAANPW
jgi:TetR/AcrR family transcriptional regulator, regulator of cefoperazone and chloramphenicol sensitivity